MATLIDIPEGAIRYEEAVIKDLGNGCIQVLGGKLTKSLTDVYAQTPGQPSIWCKKIPKFVTKLDGTIQFESPPPHCPKEYEPTDDERIFRPAFQPCEHRQLDCRIKPSCGCVSCLWRCKKFNKLVVPSQCDHCQACGDSN